jgi:O-antigen ligase
MVLAVFFFRRFGFKGLVLGGIGGLPLMILGGRSGEEADASSLERLGALYEGCEFFKQSPIFGLGQDQFRENYFITAHNSYLLTAAELGFPGLVIWGMLLYVSVKIPYAVASYAGWSLDPRLRIYALSLVAAFGGFLIGIFFLSFNTQPLLFIYLGLAGALYGTAKQNNPGFDVKVSAKEVGLVTVLAAMVIGGLFVYTRIKGSG